MIDEVFAKKYRTKDRELISKDSRLYRCQKLYELTNSFVGKPNVLDLGCGTGRYFHCISNASLMVGVDSSADMLNEAIRPVNARFILANKTILLNKDIFDVKFDDRSFDFIFSIGLLAECCELTSDFCDKVYGWLKAGGRFYFTAKKGNDGLAINYDKLANILNSTKFKHVAISEYESKPPGWAGVHYDCVVYK